MKRFLLSLFALMFFAVAPVSAKRFIDNNWLEVNVSGTSPSEWVDLDTQHRAYSAAKESGHEAMAKGEYQVAAEFFAVAAENAIWSRTQNWMLNNQAFCLLKTVTYEDGLTSAERSQLKLSLVIYEDALSVCDTAEALGEKLDGVSKCRATVNRSYDSVRISLGD